MIKQYKMHVANIPSERFMYHWGYRFYGMLMEQIDSDYAERLHMQSLTPVSQCLVPIRGRNEAVWTVNLFGEEAVKQFSSVLEHNNSFFMEHYQMQIKVQTREYIYFPTEKDVMAAAAKAYDKTRFTMSFQTPTSFKSENEYMLFPSVKHIVNSLINKWNAYSDTCYFDDEDAVRFLIQGLKINSYRLQSSYYHLKGSKIPGFIGEITVNARLPVPLMELWKLLLYFSQYSGVGIKTSLGMGGVSAKERVNK